MTIPFFLIVAVVSISDLNPNTVFKLSSSEEYGDLYLVVVGEWQVTTAVGQLAAGENIFRFVKTNEVLLVLRLLEIKRLHF